MIGTGVNANDTNPRRLAAQLMCMLLNICLANSGHAAAKRDLKIAVVQYSQSKMVALNKTKRSLEF